MKMFNNVKARNKKSALFERLLLEQPKDHVIMCGCAVCGGVGGPGGRPVNSPGSGGSGGSSGDSGGSKGSGGSGGGKVLEESQIQQTHLPFFGREVPIASRVSDRAPEQAAGPSRRTFLAILSGRTGPLQTPPSAKIESEHLNHLAKLAASGSLVTCGLFASLDRGLLVLREESKEKAETVVAKDPLLVHRYYERFEIDEILSPSPNER
jgi:uncharacterized protein YciI